MDGRIAAEGLRASKRRSMRWLGLALSIGVHVAVYAAMTAWQGHMPATPVAPSVITVMVALPAMPEKPADVPPLPPPLQDQPKTPQAIDRMLPTPARVALKQAPPAPPPILPSSSSPMASALDAPPSVTVEEAQNLARQQYMTQLWSHLARFRPPRIRGHGTASISFTLSADGALLEARLSIASNNHALNRAALATVRKAAPFPPLPRELTPGPCRFEIAFDAQ